MIPLTIGMSSFENINMSSPTGLNQFMCVKLLSCVSVSRIGACVKFQLMT